MELGDSLNLRKYPFMCVGNKLLIPKIIPHKKNHHILSKKEFN